MRSSGFVTRNVIRFIVVVLICLVIGIQGAHGDNGAGVSETDSPRFEAPPKSSSNFAIPKVEGACWIHVMPDRLRVIDAGNPTLGFQFGVVMLVREKNLSFLFSRLSSGKDLKLSELANDLHLHAKSQGSNTEMLLVEVARGSVAHAGSGNRACSLNDVIFARYRTGPIHAEKLYANQCIVTKRYPVVEPREDFFYIHTASISYDNDMGVTIEWLTDKKAEKLSRGAQSGAIRISSQPPFVLSPLKNGQSTSFPGDKQTLVLGRYSFPVTAVGKSEEGAKHSFFSDGIGPVGAAVRPPAPVTDLPAAFPQVGTSELLLTKRLVYYYIPGSPRIEWTNNRWLQTVDEGSYKFCSPDRWFLAVKTSQRGSDRLLALPPLIVITEYLCLALPGALVLWIAGMTIGRRKKRVGRHLRFCAIGLLILFLGCMVALRQCNSTLKAFEVSPGKTKSDVLNELGRPNLAFYPKREWWEQKTIPRGSTWMYVIRIPPFKTRLKVMFGKNRIRGKSLSANP